MTREMSAPEVRLKVRVRRGGPYREEAPHWQQYHVTAPGDFTVAELLEKIKGEIDPTLVYRHSCHHGSCGTCAMRINGEERLACTTGVTEVVGRDGRLQLEPLTHLPWAADLACDPAPFLDLMEALGPGHLRPAGETFQPLLPDEARVAAASLEAVESSSPSGMESTPPEGRRPFMRFADCIECGACVSACPIANPAGGYIGPAPLAAARDAVVSGQEPGAGLSGMFDLVSGPHGVWQCHETFECTRVCPADLDVAGGIMTMRRLVMRKGDKGGVPDGAAAT